MTHISAAISFGGRVTALTDELISGALGSLPAIGGALLLLLAGWLLALLLRALTHRLVQWLDLGLRRLLGEGRAARLPVARSSNLLGGVVFWGVILLFGTAATQTLGLPVFTQWLTRLLEYLPTIVAGLLIIVAGVVLARFAADLVLSGSGSMPLAQRTALARAAQLTILVGAILVGAEQIGIKVTFVAIFAGAALLAIAGGVVVATSLGARWHVANMIGVYQLRQSFSAGQQIRIAGHEGRILELTGYSVVLETEEGRLVIPGAVFSREAVLLRVDGGEHDQPR